MDGILLFKKPILWTSHDAVDFVRRRIDQQAVGHAGTLDPMATGLLVLLLGKATKLSQELSSSDKVYAGTMLLGVTTDTQDLEGRFTSKASAEDISERQIEAAFLKLTGIFKQTPPAFSATKTKGKKMYQWARKGISIEIPKKDIHVREFKMLRVHEEEIFFLVRCSKGTYVRSLCDEAGKILGCGATLSSLIRIQSGEFLAADAIGDRELLTMTRHEIEGRLIRNRHENLLRTAR